MLRRSQKLILRLLAGGFQFTEPVEIGFDLDQRHAQIECGFHHLTTFEERVSMPKQKFGYVVGHSDAAGVWSSPGHYHTSPGTRGKANSVGLSNHAVGCRSESRGRGIVGIVKICLIGGVGMSNAATCLIRPEESVDILG